MTKIVLPTCSWNKDDKRFDVQDAYFDESKLRGMHLRTYYNQENKSDKSKSILFSGSSVDKEIIVNMTSKELFDHLVYLGVFQAANYK